MSVFGEFALTLVIALLGATTAFVISHLRKTTGTDSSAPIFALSRRTADWIFIGMACAYVLIFGALSILRHESFHSGGFDLGIFDQNIWNSLHGRLFQVSIPVKVTLSLGQHFSPLLLAIVPLYALWADPRTLLALQTVALATAALPLYWFARKQLGNELALALTAAFFLSPALQSVNLWDFHEIALATPLLAFALYFLLNQRRGPFLICLILALLTKEEVGLIMAAFGIYIFFVQRQRRLGLGLAIFGGAWAGIMLLYVIPLFRDPFYGLDYQYVDRYQYLGGSVTEIISTMLTQPDLVLQHLVAPAKIEFMLHLLVPLAFTPLIGVQVFALALPTLGYLLIGDNPFQNSIRFQYTAQLLPFIFFAAAIGLKRVLSWRVSYGTFRSDSRIPGTLALAVLISVAGIVNYFFQSAGPLGRHFEASQYTITTHTLQGYELMRSFPLDASVLADMGLVPHLSHRQRVYEASIQDPPNLRKIDYIFADQTAFVHQDFPIIWEGILDSPYFETILDQDGYLVKKRATPKITHSAQIQFDARIALLGYSVESGEPARRGESTRLILTWRAEQNIRERYVTFVHLIDAQNQIWAQDDREPMNGWLRTDRWDAGDVTIDGFTLELPSEMPSGDYRITAGLYATTDQKTLAARDPSGKLLGSEPVLGILHVVANTK